MSRRDRILNALVDAIINGTTCLTVAFILVFGAMIALGLWEVVARALWPAT